MTTLEIVALVIILVGAAVAVSFLVAGIIEMYTEKGIRLPRPKKVKEQEIEEEEIEEQVQEDAEIDIDQMLARLEARKEELEEDKTEEVVEEEFVFPAVEEEVIQEVVEEPVEEAVEEVVEEPEAEVEDVVEEETAEEVEDADDAIIEESEVEEAVEKPVVIETEVDKFDYKTRLEKIKESQEKIERDLEKTQKAINRYERTERRRARNQKLLDKKATELTNINLVMYSVTDIKNVDQEKKAKQEELTAHIAELKASIQDAEEDLAKNESKYQNNVKLLSYLKNEKHRYEEEVKELENFVNDVISQKIEVLCEEMPIEKAKESGALGIFDNKYGEIVKVYTIGNVSKEMCGGPHAKNTFDLGKFKIMKEESSSAGVRRIKAILQ